MAQAIPEVLPYTIAYNLLSCFAVTNLVSSSETSTARTSIAGALEMDCWLPRLALMTSSDVCTPGKPYVAGYNLHTTYLTISASRFTTLEKHCISAMNKISVPVRVMKGSLL